jgi:LmbE family N-acetylglucosaminyl deacetylase
MNWRADGEKWRELSEQLQARVQAGSPITNLRILLLAAHPDDETIGASVLLSRFPQTSVAFLTDGAPRDTRLWSSGLNCSREEYSNLRRDEAIVALSHAGISARNLVQLGAIDQEAVFEISSLTEAFVCLLKKLRPTVVITHPYEGGHPDHDSAAVIAAVAVSQMEGDLRPALLEMTSYHAQDGRCVTGEFLHTDCSPKLCFQLSDWDRERKRQMIEAYASQRLVLENFPLDQEWLRLAPKYAFTQPPHEGKVWYECVGWPMTGSGWRELAAAAIAECEEHSCH